MIDLSTLGTRTSGYGERVNPITKKVSDHKGIDIVLHTSNIPAVRDGSVVETGFTNVRGNYIKLSHADGSTTLYQHMANPATLAVGDTVKEGQTIGTQGDTGWSTGAHLHFEVQDAAGDYVDPIAYMSSTPKDPVTIQTSTGSDGGGWVSSMFSAIIKFLAYVALAILAVYLFMKAFDIKLNPMQTVKTKAVETVTKTLDTKKE